MHNLLPLKINQLVEILTMIVVNTRPMTTMHLTALEQRQNIQTILQHQAALIVAQTVLLTATLQ